VKLAQSLIDWCCFSYFVRNSLVALLEALCARIFFLDPWTSVFLQYTFVAVNTSKLQSVRLSKHLNLISLLRASCRRKGCWIPTTIFVYSYLSFFLGFRRPNLITGLSGWRAAPYTSLQHDILQHPVATHRENACRNSRFARIAAAATHAKKKKY